MDASSAYALQLYVSPAGKDQWSGRLPEPAADGKDGPLATLSAAQERIRRLKGSAGGQSVPFTRVAGLAGPVVVWLRGGRYPLGEPIVFTPDDSAPVTYAAYPGETPILDGGVRISQWRTTTVNGRAAWVADLPDVAAGKWAFRELFVNGERRLRPRLPRQGLFRMQEAPGMPLPGGWGAGGYTQFVAGEGEVGAFRNLGDVEVVYVHFWIEERSPIAAYDPQTRRVTMSRPSRTNLVGSFGSQLADYYLDNVFEALQEPGEWYLDRGSGQLYYLPLPGETPETTEVFAPRALQLLRLVGDPDAGRYVEYVRFHGLTFQHTDWRHPGEDAAASLDLFENPSVAGTNRGPSAACGQAAADVPGVISMKGARHCAVEDCVVRNAGWYAFYIGDGCSGIRLVGNEMRDLGAGGVKINGSAVGEALARRTGLNRVTDNHIHQAGRVFHSAVGILAMHTFNNTLSHNHIHDLYYTGISCGWVWGYADSVCQNNRIERNHIHQLGQKLLSDMGGVYLLGVQPGTVVRGNLIHDIDKAHYGGWALYTDEGSSHILLENNVCYRTNGHVFHQHYGRENTVRNNVLAFADEAMVAYTRVESHVGFTFTRNIVLSRGAPMFQGLFGEPGGRKMISDLNLFWDLSRAAPAMNSAKAGEPPRPLAAWRELGFDGNSLVADPRFVNPEAFDFRLAPDSPAVRLGFRPIDLSDVGPRPLGQRTDA